MNMTLDMPTRKRVSMLPGVGWTGARRVLPAIALVAMYASAVDSALAAEMAAREVRVRPSAVGELTVSGSIDGESTFGWTVMVQLVPRSDARGSLEFTTVPETATPRRATFEVRSLGGQAASIALLQQHALEMDIRQGADVWPDVGSFTPFDTDRSGSRVRNGAVDDNGTLLKSSVSFDGVLARFPIRAGQGASGTWDVLLYTRAGESGWEDCDTRLVNGTVTVTPEACRSAQQCNDGNPCTSDTCQAGTCSYADIDDCKRSRRATKGRRSLGK